MQDYTGLYFSIGAMIQFFFFTLFFHLTLGKTNFFMIYTNTYVFGRPFYFLLIVTIEDLSSGPPPPPLDCK